MKNDNVCHKFSKLTQHNIKIDKVLGYKTINSCFQRVKLISFYLLINPTYFRNVLDSCAMMDHVCKTKFIKCTIFLLETIVTNGSGSHNGAFTRPSTQNLYKLNVHLIQSKVCFIYQNAKKNLWHLHVITKPHTLLSNQPFFENQFDEIPSSLLQVRQVSKYLTGSLEVQHFEKKL